MGNILMYRNRVALVDLGENLPISLETLTRKLNSRQKSFFFEPVEAVTSSKIGEPDDEVLRFNYLAT